MAICVVFAELTHSDLPQPKTQLRTVEKCVTITTWTVLGSVLPMLIMPKSALTGVHLHGLSQEEHGLLPVGGCVLGAGAEAQGMARHVKHNIKVPDKSLGGRGGRGRNVHRVHIMRSHM